MTDPTSRRNFLRGRFSRRQGPLRPPWALEEQDFLNACTRCGECSRVCPTHVISTRDGGYPAIDFSEGECSFCGDCVAVCATGALKRQADGKAPAGVAPWQARAKIGEHCLAQQRVECRVCGEHCAAGAIRFSPVLGGPPLPTLDSARCTGCGACVSPCPTRAITVS